MTGAGASRIMWRGSGRSKGTSGGATSGTGSSAATGSSRSGPGPPSASNKKSKAGAPGPKGVDGQAMIDDLWRGESVNRTDARSRGGTRDENRQVRLGVHKV